MAEIVMPRLSDTMEEGTILRWLKRNGEMLRRGEELVEIETDKATMTVTAEATGVLHLVAAVGDSVPVGALIARIGSAAPLLFGHRGQPTANVAALEDLLLRVGALAHAVPELAELDLNPVVVSERGAVPVDAKLRLRTVPPGPGPLSRKLR